MSFCPLRGDRAADGIRTSGKRVPGGTCRHNCDGHPERYPILHTRYPPSGHLMDTPAAPGREMKNVQMVANNAAELLTVPGHAPFRGQGGMVNCFERQNTGFS